MKGSAWVASSVEWPGWVWRVVVFVGRLIHRWPAIDTTRVYVSKDEVSIPSVASRKLWDEWVERARHYTEEGTDVEVVRYYPGSFIEQGGREVWGAIILYRLHEKENH